MNVMTDAALADQLGKIFKLACAEKDWEVAEFLLQALEAIAKREGDDGQKGLASEELLEHLPRRGLH